jgi:hypothetical protein
LRVRLNQLWGRRSELFCSLLRRENEKERE